MRNLPVGSKIADVSTMQSHRHDEGVLKNNNVARAGLSEMDTGRFSENTKINEGVLPGNNGRRSEY